MRLAAILISTGTDVRTATDRHSDHKSFTKPTANRFHLLLAFLEYDSMSSIKLQGCDITASQGVLNADVISLFARRLGKDAGDNGRANVRAPESSSKACCMLSNSPFACRAIESGSRTPCPKRRMTNCDQIASEMPQSTADKSKICNHSR